LPLQLGLAPGEAHDNQLCTELLMGLQAKSMLLADRGYEADWIRALVNQQGGLRQSLANHCDPDPPGTILSFSF
jgi:transposase